MQEPAFVYDTINLCEDTHAAIMKRLAENA
jgi:hypothetical protein